MSNKLATHQLAESFNQLTPHQIVDALATQGMKLSGRFIIMNSYENRVYQLELDDGSFVVGKFYRPGRWSDETILDEHHFLQELVAAEIPVAAPITLANNKTLGLVEGIRFALFPRIGGRSPQEMNDDQLRRVGRLIARIHNVGAKTTANHRLSLNPTTYGEQNLNYLLENNIIADQAKENYEVTARALIDRITPMFDGVPTIRIHGDCHMANLIDTPKGVTFLDFDDMVNGPAVQDIWLLAGSPDAAGVASRKALVAGYEEFRAFNPAWFNLVEPLRALRYLHYTTWIARRWHDPAFKKTFAHFGTLQYWQTETNDLREQIARIDQQQLYYA